ncbi:MmgE/PrpD family protein [Conexibacter sp. S30A1]|uniref:MmgE/PrpD family protein n=1 Tax=Conexibacter sp. S30A1 TaxID=2937800 RepID=UPI0021114925|nr:MmgE/PrpD family protein [Conexibacter sp. S30A1]
MFASLTAGDLDGLLSASAVRAARLDLLDTLGCAVAGQSALGVPEARRLLIGQGGTPEAGVWGSGCRLPAAQAAFVNAMSAHALDYDDIHPGVTHTGVTVIPAALATAEAATNVSVASLLEAIVLGSEVADRIALSVLDGPGVTGWLLTPLAGVFGSAAAAARLYGLSADGIRHALGFAYVQASGNGQSTLDGALAKRMQPGFAARGGVFAAQLARQGLTAPLDSLEGRRGFFAVYHNGRYDRALLHHGHPGGWLIEAATFKPYPCCGWTHTALECGLHLRSQVVSLENVRSVRILVNAQAYNSTGTPTDRRYKPKTAVDGQFSIPYVFAVAMANGEVQIADFDPSALARGDVLALAGKVHVAVDRELVGDAARGLSPASATVVLDDGQMLKAQITHPCGVSPPLDQNSIEKKFRGCCLHAGLSDGFADAVIELVLGDGGSATTLADLLT